jgi:F-type H+-transporting ATPase subunit b
VVNIKLNITFFIQIVNFLVFIIVINWVLVKPILKVLDERRNRVEGNEEESERLTAEAEKVIAEYEATLKEARIEANREKDRLRTEGIEREAEIIKTAKEETKKMTDRLKEEIARESSVALTEMKKEAGLLSKVIAEKILEREI